MPTILNTHALTSIHSRGTHVAGHSSRTCARGYRFGGKRGGRSLLAFAQCDRIAARGHHLVMPGGDAWVLRKLGAPGLPCSCPCP